MREVGRISKMYQRSRRCFKPVAIILTYHRVVNRAMDPYGIVVSPDHFAQHLQWIKHACCPIHLRDLVRAVQQHHSIPRRAVVLTFDDGYEDFYSQAYPYLVSARIPATVFVATGHTDSQDNFWYDELAAILLLTERIPPSLRLTIDGEDHRWGSASAGERQCAHREIYKLLQPLAPAQRSDILDNLAQWADVERPRCVEDRVMTSAELIQLAHSGLIEIGAHTITHPVLSALPADSQYLEIAGSRRMLESIIEAPVLTFAYPYGERPDFTEETVHTVVAAGFEAACTTIPGVVDSVSDRFQLRRRWVGDWNLETFRKNLEWYFLQ